MEPLVSISAGNFAWVPIVFIVAVAAVGLGLITALVMIIRGFQLRRDSRRLTDEEAEQLCRVMESLTKMEGRIANLETILLERGRERSDRGRMG